MLLQRIKIWLIDVLGVDPRGTARRRLERLERERRESYDRERASYAGD